MNEFHGLYVQQGGNQYRLWTEQGLCLAHLVMPADGQYILDSKALDLICKVIAKRWKI